MSTPGRQQPFVKANHNQLVPLRKERDEATEPEKSKQEIDTHATRQQLVDQFIIATQNPPPGPGGILGISGPFDAPAPVETPDEYRRRPSIGTVKPFRHIGEEIDPEIRRAERRGDDTFAQVREGDKADAGQSSLSVGNAKTWLILGGACTIWLLFLLMLIVLPHGRDAHVPNVFLY